MVILFIKENIIFQSVVALFTGKQVVGLDDGAHAHTSQRSSGAKLYRFAINLFELGISINLIDAIRPH